MTKISTIEQFYEVFENVTSAMEARELLNRTTKPVLIQYAREVFCSEMFSKMKKAEIVSYVLANVKFEEDANKLIDLSDLSTSSYESGEALMEHNLEVLEQCKTEQELADTLNTVQKIMIAEIGYRYVEKGYYLDLGTLSKAELIKIVVSAIMKKRNPEPTPEQIDKCIKVWQKSFTYTVPDTARLLYEKYKVSELEELAVEVGFTLELKTLKSDIARKLAQYIDAVTAKYYSIWKKSKTETPEQIVTTEPEYVLSEFVKKDVVALREERQRNEFKSGVKFINDVLAGVIPIDQAISSTRKNYEVFEVVGMSARLSIDFDERIYFGMLHKAVVEALERLARTRALAASVSRQQLVGA